MVVAWKEEEKFVVFLVFSIIFMSRFWVEKGGRKHRK